MAAARRAVETDALGAAAELPGMGLQPADAVVDVLERRRIGRFRRVAELEREHDDAAAHQIHGGLLTVGAVLVVPGAAVHLDHRRERTGACRLIEPRHALLAAISLVDDVSDLELVVLRRAGLRRRCGRCFHRLHGCRRCVERKHGGIKGNHGWGSPSVSRGEKNVQIIRERSRWRCVREPAATSPAGTWLPSDGPPTWVTIQQWSTPPPGTSARQRCSSLRCATIARLRWCC